MAHQYPQAGRCLQQVTHQVFEANLQTNQSTYSYNKVSSSNKSFAIKETGSLLIVESYCQGWLNGSGGGLDMTIYWNGGTGDNMLGRGSSSNSPKSTQRVQPIQGHERAHRVKHLKRA